MKPNELVACDGASGVGGGSAARPLDGNEWQERVRRWLRLRYPNDFQPVPAMHGGDRAIEGYSLDGNVYQCYAARDGFDVKALYEHQRKKLSEDLGKFVKYREKLLKVLPRDFRVRRYCFVVPKYDSAKLIEYAHQKAAEVRAAQLPYVADDFEVVVLEREDFAVERAIEEQNAAVRLNVELPEVSTDEVSDWSAEHGSGAERLERKIKRFTGLKSTRAVRGARNAWIRAQIRTENALSSLRSKSPAIWEELNRVRVQHERRLALRYATHLGPSEAVQNAAKELAAAMQKQVPNLERGDADGLADGIVADWLQKCALNPTDEEDESDGDAP